ncbi:YcxB family protein [Streptomyces shenzhenensis]|uniref:YcxB family protein n=1 Tax=Streptomyces shenzhenensis TaxID=943815 RepID=UPI0015F0D201|nr:YcxB family protein [Streptomyces shenzhenensis]
MIMDMGRDAGQGVVELAYQPVAGDFLGALRERERLRRRRGWVRRWTVGLIAFAFVLNASLSLAGNGKPDWFLLIWMPLAAALLLCTPRLQARAFLKLAVRNGTYRATVTDAGLTVATDNSTTSVNWAAQSRYRETEDAFITYSDDKNASCFTVLPKRGLPDPADADRLRAILDRHLTRG